MIQSDRTHDRSPDAPTPITTTLESLVECARRLVEEDEAVSAVVLYGSRACGTDRPDSDFDVMLVTPDDGPLPLDALRTLRALGGVDAQFSRASTLVEERDTALAVASAVARDGILIAGEWTRPTCDPQGVHLDREALLDSVMFIASTLTHAGAAQAGARAGNGAADGDAVRFSRDAAEELCQVVLAGWGARAIPGRARETRAEQLRAHARKRAANGTLCTQDEACVAHDAAGLERLETMNGASVTETNHRILQVANGTTAWLARLARRSAVARDALADIRVRLHDAAKKTADTDTVRRYASHSVEEALAHWQTWWSPDPDEAPTWDHDEGTTPATIDPRPATTPPPRGAHP